MTCFFDTNVLIYAVDGRFPDKQKKALALYAQSVQNLDFVISTQVLIEFYNAVTKGKYPLLPRHEAQTQITTLSRQRVIPTTAAMVVAATDHAVRHQMQWFDALMVESALSAGATTLYSEDMQPGRKFGNLILVNPFA